jgi:protein MpaA
MNKQRVLLAVPALLGTVLLTAVLLGSCASGHREPYSEAPPRVRDLSALEDQLRAAVAASDRLEMTEAGRVAYQGFEAPLWVVGYRALHEQHRVLVTGGVHGNEPAGAAWVVELIGSLSAEPDAYATTSFELVPLVNPWGWVHDQRYNGEGRDINRDFASFATQEARILRGFLDSKRYDLVIDHHEDPDASGVYLYQYALRDKTASRRALQAVRALGYPLEQEVNMVILRTRDGLIDAPRWGLSYMRMTRQLSVTNFLRLQHSDLVYTVETPVSLPMQARLQIHRTVFELLAAQYR